LQLQLPLPHYHHTEKKKNNWKLGEHYPLSGVISLIIVAAIAIDLMERASRSRMIPRIIRARVAETEHPEIKRNPSAPIREMYSAIFFFYVLEHENI